MAVAHHRDMNTAPIRVINLDCVSEQRRDSRVNSNDQVLDTHVTLERLVPWLSRASYVKNDAAPAVEPACCRSSHYS